MPRKPRSARDEPHADPDDDLRDEPDHVVYYDLPLDEAHDEDGTVDDDVAANGDAYWRERMSDQEPALWLRLRWRFRWAAYAAAFAIPLLVFLILAVVLLTLSEGEEAASPASVASSIPTAAVSGAWPAHLAFAQHSVPAYIRDEIAAGGAQMGYLFYGEADEVWLITVEPIADSLLDPVALLYGPSGDLLAMGSPRSSADTAAEIWLPLPESGPYRLVVEGGSGGPVGTYLLTLFVQ